MSEPPRRSIGRRVLRMAVLLFVTYLGIIVVFWFLERRLVFIPSSAEEAWLPAQDPRSQDMSFTSGDGNTLSGRWIPPESLQHGAVLITNGNAGNLTHRGRLAADLRKELGAGVLLSDYPGYGKSTGKPTEESCYASGEAAYKWLTDEQKIAPNRVILCGESLGGGTAVELATKHEHRALVLIYTFTSLPAAAKHRFPFLPVHTMMRTRFDNLSKIGRCPRPVFFIHGTTDNVIPFDHSAQLFAATNTPKHFVKIEGVGHTMLLGDPFTVELAKFLNEHAP